MPFSPDNENSFVGAFIPTEVTVVPGQEEVLSGAVFAETSEQAEIVAGIVAQALGGEVIDTSISQNPSVSSGPRTFGYSRDFSDRFEALKNNPNWDPQNN